MPNRQHKAVIGISIEGNSLRAVKVVRKPGQCEISWVKTFTLPTVPEPDIKESATDTLDFGAIDTAVELKDDVQNAQMIETGVSNDVYIQIMDLTESGKIPVALAITEPQTYYNLFDSNWGLSGRNLIRKLISESGLSRNSFNQDIESIRLVEMKSGRLMAISHEKHLSFFHQMESLRKHTGHRPPKIVLVDGVETAVINLINEYQYPLDGSITIIVHVTAQTSRFIFMNGTEIFHISQLIGEGENSTRLSGTLYNRLQYEIDNLNIKKIDSIILSGSANRAGVKDYFDKYFSPRTVRPMKLHSLDMLDLEKADRDDIAPYAPALGVACRLVDEQMKCLYELDLTPTNIREAQNRLSLSAAGWALLLGFPLITSGFMYEINRASWELKQSQAQLIPKRAQVETSKALEENIQAVSERLEAYRKTSVLFDSLDAQGESYGGLLDRVSSVSKAYKGTWLTEMQTGDAGRIEMVGYALDRMRIPAYVETVGGELNSVDAQEIREHAVYRFEINTGLKNRIE